MGFDPKTFIVAGNATFTIGNSKTGNYRTFKVRQANPEETNKPKRFFVSVLNGPDNENSYMYIGMIFETKNWSFTLTKGSKAGKDSMSVQMFNYVWERLINNRPLLDVINIQHAGKCGRCGRKLTVPESIESGFGPECITKIGLAV